MSSKEPNLLDLKSTLDKDAFKETDHYNGWLVRPSSKGGHFFTVTFIVLNTINTVGNVRISYSYCTVGRFLRVLRENYLDLADFHSTSDEQQKIMESFFKCEVEEEDPLFSE